MSQGNPDDRRYSDEEFAEIVRTAAELEARSRPRPTGLSLEQIRAIAAEAGLDPAAVTRAARALERRRGPMERLAGGPAAYSFTRVVPGVPGQARYRDVLDVIRELMADQGVAAEVAGGLEWKSEGTLDQIHVDVSPRDGRTRVTVRGDRRVPAILAATVPLAAWFIAFGLTAQIVDLSTGAETAALGVGYFVAALGAARTIWSHTGARLRRRLLALVEEVAQEAARV